MGGYADVDYLGEGDMDTAVFALDWIVGVALSSACNDPREVDAESACLCIDDYSHRIGSRRCGLYRIGHSKRLGGSSTTISCSRVRGRVAFGERL